MSDTVLHEAGRYTREEIFSQPAAWRGVLDDVVHLAACDLARDVRVDGEGLHGEMQRALSQLAVHPRSGVGEAPQSALTSTVSAGEPLADDETAALLDRLPPLQSAITDVLPLIHLPQPTRQY